MIWQRTWGRPATLSRHAPITATLLPNGKVLRARRDARNGLSSAELYDLARGRGRDRQPCYGTPTHGDAAANGKVLVAAERDNAPPRRAELYDSASGTGRRPPALSRHVLSHGDAAAHWQVLVAGEIMAQLEQRRAA